MISLMWNEKKKKRKKPNENKHIDTKNQGSGYQRGGVEGGGNGKRDHSVETDGNYFGERAVLCTEVEI